MPDTSTLISLWRGEATAHLMAGNGGLKSMPTQSLHNAFGQNRLAPKAPFILMKLGVPAKHSGICLILNQAASGMHQRFHSINVPRRRHLWTWAL